MQQCVLDRHISRVHAEMVKCPECDKSVSQPRLDAHMATHVAKSVTCNECSFEAASSHSLEQVWQNSDKILTKFMLMIYTFNFSIYFECTREINTSTTVNIASKKKLNCFKK